MIIILTNYIIVFEAVDNLSVSHFMHEGSFEADTLDLVHRILFMVSRPTKLSHNCLSQDLIVLCVCPLSMPINDRLGVIEAAKAYQREQQRLRTESRLAQLGQDQRELEFREVLTLFAFIWVLGIVLFFARLYLGPSV